MKTTANKPIGVFDSGVGGLTVANAIKNELPDESIIYFGDTAHLPYGDKSAELIKFYSVRIADFLLQHDCKAVVIACNTASAHAFQTVKDHINETNPEVLVINVIDPAVEYLAQDNKYRKIGVIGTQGTINSGMYQQKIKEQCAGVEVVPFATRLFVPMIEEGFIFDDISNAIIRSYLSNTKLQNLDALILACTHYPIIKNQIRKFFDFQVKVIDSSQIVANFLKRELIGRKLQQNENKPNYQFFVSDYTTTFETIASMFFEDEVKLQRADLWK